MRFTVLWSPSAEAQLAEIWLDLRGRRDEVTEAAAQIDPLLREDPREKGRPYDTDRILRLPPLAIVYSIEDGDRMVKILAIQPD